MKNRVLIYWSCISSIFIRLRSVTLILTFASKKSKKSVKDKNTNFNTMAMFFYLLSARKTILLPLESITIISESVGSDLNDKIVIIQTSIDTWISINYYIFDY